MLTIVDIQKLIDECRHTGAHGLGNGSRGVIDELEIDILTPPADFLGVKSNPAIFVNHDTYSLLGKYHPEWKRNKTIAVKESVLRQNPMIVIGIIVHESGHAFNVAASLANSEANAYIFEIEVISCWFRTKNPVLLNLSSTDLYGFFQSRLPFYRLESGQSDYLAGLIKTIETNDLFNPPSPLPDLTKTPQACRSHRFVIPATTFAKAQPTTFFKDEASPRATPSGRDQTAEKALAENWGH